MDVVTLEAELRGHETDSTLADEVNLAGRARVRDFAALLADVARVRRDDPTVRLAKRAGRLSRALARRDAAVIRRVDRALRSGALRGERLRAELDRFTSYRPSLAAPLHLGYDSLDVLLDGVFRSAPLADASDALPPEMVHYETTPARVILELLDRVPLGPSDVFYDLGSGDGRVALLVHFLTGARCKGVEIQPALGAYAARAASRLGARGVTFLTADAREVDYSDATAFYLFTPFRGPVLDTVLGRVRDTARPETVVVCTYGPCTRMVGRARWLRLVEPTMEHDFRLAVWDSVGR